MASELIELTVAEAAERMRSGELSRDEYFDAWREAAASDSLNAYLWTADDAAQADLEGTRAAGDGRAADGPLEGILVARPVRAADQGRHRRRAGAAGGPGPRRL